MAKPQRYTVLALGLAALAALHCGSDDGPPLSQDVPSMIPSVRVANPNHGEKLPAAPPAKPACKPSIGEKGAIHIEKTATALTFPEKAQLSVYPLDSGHVLLTTQWPWRKENKLPAKGTLWKISCEAPHAHEVFFEREGADFGSGALSADRRSLFYTTIEGVEAIQLGSKTPRTITQPGPAEDTCWNLGEAKPSYRNIDIVSGVDPQSGTLLLDRGSFCGPRDTWTAERLHLPDPTSQKRKQPKRPQLITTLVKDVLGRLYAGDGGTCDQPGLTTPHTPGVIFKSTDRGRSWRAITVKIGTGKMHSGAKTILADGKRPGHLVVLSSLCQTPLGSYGGIIYQTRDGGRTWRKVPVPGYLGQQGSMGVGVSDVALIGGSIDRMYVWNHKGHRYKSQNTGKTWEESASTKGVPKQPTQIQLKGTSLSVELEGVTRTQKGGLKRLIHPQQALKAQKGKRP